MSTKNVDDHVNEKLHYVEKILQTKLIYWSSRQDTKLASLTSSVEYRLGTEYSLQFFLCRQLTVHRVR